MKEVTNYRKSKVYSDVEPNIPIATFMEYLGKSGESCCFKFRGGEESYFEGEKEGFGVCISFPDKNGMYPISATQLGELIKQGRIKE